MARPKNIVQGEQLTISLPPGIIDLLEQLSAMHGYGKNASETASEIVRVEIRRLITSGELDKLQVRLPPQRRQGTGDSSESDG